MRQQIDLNFHSHHKQEYDDTILVWPEIHNNVFYINYEINIGMPARMQKVWKMSDQVKDFLVVDHPESEQKQIRETVRQAEEQKRNDYYIYGFNSWYHINKGQIMGQGKNGPLMDNRNKPLENQPDDAGAREWKLYLL